MVKKMCRAIDQGLGFVEDWSLVLAVGIALLTAMANVVLRKVTADYSLYWSDEVVRKVIYFSTYIGCVAAVRNRSLIRIDALPQMLPVLQKPLTFIAHIAVLIFSTAMLYLGYQMTMMMYEDEFARTATLNIPEWYFYAILPIMGGLMFIRTLLVMCEGWWKEDEEDA